MQFYILRTCSKIISNIIIENVGDPMFPSLNNELSYLFAKSVIYKLKKS